MRDDHTEMPPVVSISQFCSMMSISRSRYYQILGEELILPPVYSIESRRPFFTREIAQINLAVKKNNIGVNGRICLFYNQRNVPTRPVVSRKSARSERKESVPENDYSELTDGLVSLGLAEVKPSQVKAAVQSSYPEGTDGVDEGEVLKTIFCVIRAQNSKDNVDR